METLIASLTSSFTVFALLSVKVEQKYKHLKHKYEDMKQSNKAEMESLTENWEAELSAKEKELEKLKFNLSLSPSKDSIESLKADKKKLEDKVYIPQVTRGHNFVADGWVGASNPHPHPNYPSSAHKYKQEVSITLV